ncbi:hypothetical protein J2Z76_001125 [Sedimentibacter acidaminivorans]|uniref:DUF4007 domain-containing protein n=1 Tax=Sedimentibacter acidaminivorans TaxID=913099 RepID=A0ABS4GC53_9FIRM|nr:DUF4007 family protein [Sedimentibacter acidaminivorans]MBP1925268.1 hypothetical protein [Sedimentibacter acidaminivorans]
MSEKKVPFKLRGHEKFVLREGWLNKGLIVVEDDPRIFLDSDGPDKLGVGNNMVRSIRYWLKAFNLISERPSRGANLTELGKIIKENDIYFEDVFTLWVLHSNLVKNIKNATSWYIFFNRCDIEEFKRDEINNILINELKKYIGDEKFSVNSVKDDIDVILNMYSSQRGNNEDPEDKNISPFSILGLLYRKEDVYYRNQPDLRKINYWIVLYELCCLFEREDSISIDRISVGDESLGNIYNLSRVTVNEFLDRLDSLNYIKVDRTAGLDMIYKKSNITAESVIRSYYNEHK